MIDGFRYGFLRATSTGCLAVVACLFAAVDVVSVAVCIAGSKCSLTRARLQSSASSEKYRGSQNSIKRYIEQGLAMRRTRGDRRRPAFRSGDRQRGRSRASRRVHRHQLVYAALGDRMREEIHALVDAGPSRRKSGPQRQSADVDKLVDRRRRAAARARCAISGAKNAALPILCAALLAAEPLDVTQRAAPARRHARCWRCWRNGRRGRHCARRRRVALDAAAHRLSRVAPYELVKTMRASILVLGPLLARFGEARRVAARRLRDRLAARSTSTSRACRRWAPRSIVEHGYINARAQRLRGARFVLDLVTVTGTENLMMAATLAEGTTVLENAAREPEVVDLARLPHRDGRAHRRRRHRPHRDRGRRTAARRDARGHAGPHRDRHVSRRRRGDRRRRAR